jgi:hypothetical protein
MTTIRQKAHIPEITAWVESLREAFGTEEINSLIRRGRDGQPVFFAQERGATYGTPLPKGDGWDASSVDLRLLESIQRREIAKR